MTTGDAIEVEAVTTAATASGGDQLVYQQRWIVCRTLHSDGTERFFGLWHSPIEAAAWAAGQHEEDPDVESTSVIPLDLVFF